MSVEAGFRVATAFVALAIAEGDVKAQIEDAVTAACQQAGDDGGTLLGDEIAAAVDGVAPDLSAPLIDSLAGAGDTAAAELAGALTEQIAVAGDASGTELASALRDATAEVGIGIAEQAGAQIDAGLKDATADVGAQIAEQVGGQLQARLPDQAAVVSAEMAAELTAGTATVGNDIATQIDEQLTAGTATVGDAIASQIGEQLTAGLDEAVQTSAAALGQIGTAGTSGVLATVASAGGIVGALTAAVSDAAAEAGGIAGVELSRNLSEAAIAAMSDEDFEAFTAMLVATATQAGEAAGVAAADGLGAGFASVDLIAAGLSTVGESMSGAAAAVVDATETVAQAEETTLRGTQAYEAELDAMFEAIYRGGAGMTVQLAAAMVEAFQGIEADTTGFSQTELAIFEEFYQTLEEQGDAAALSMAERVNILSNTALLGKDLMGAGLSSMGSPMPGATALEEELAGVGKEASGATASLGGMAGMMGGQWMWGILGAVSILPMFSSLLGGNSQAAQQAAQMHQQLAQAIAQDSGAVADNTTAVIQQALAQSNLNDLSQQLGLTQAQLIEYAAGEANVQQQVAAAYNAKTSALAKTAGTTTEYGRVVYQVNNTSQQELNQLSDQKSALDAVTSSVVQTINANRDQTDALLAAESSTQIYNAAINDLVAKQKLQAEQAKMSSQATADYLWALMPGTKAYTDAINEQLVTVEQSTITTRIHAEALNDALAPQSRLSDAAVQASLDYQAAGTAASQYKTALDGLYGQYGSTSGAQAQFTTSLDNLTGKITAGRNAVDLNTAAGAKNYTQFQSVASAAENYAEQLYKQTGDAGQATTALQNMADKLDAGAKKAGLTTDQIKQLNTELFGVPDIKQITVALDPTAAQKSMSTLDTFITGEIADINATPIQPSVSTALAKQQMAALGSFISGEIANINGAPLQAHATGGPVRAGVPVIVGDGGRPEVFVPTSDGRIYPSVGDGARALGKQGGGAQISINYYGTQTPTPETLQQMYRDLALAVR